MNKSDVSTDVVETRILGDEPRPVPDVVPTGNRLPKRKRKDRITRKMDCGVGECKRCGCLYDSWINSVK